MATFDSLPPEVIELIVEAASQRTRYSLCLVSRRLLQITEPLLYRSVELRTTAANCRFQTTLREDKVRASWVQQLIWGYGVGGFLIGFPEFS